MKGTRKLPIQGQIGSTRPGGNLKLPPGFLCGGLFSLVNFLQAPAAEVWKVSLGSAVALEKKRNDVRVEDDRLHAAGSVLAWPRHSRSAARKSSMDSSSGQKSPKRSFGSRGKTARWSAINSSTVGCPSRVYFSVNDIDDSSLAQHLPDSQFEYRTRPATLRSF